MYHRYNDARTTQMNLPANIGGAAFTDSVGSHVYVLWAKTTLDNSETTAGVYSFPPAMNVSPMLNKREWNWAVTDNVTQIPSVNIPLNGTPIFLSEGLTPLPIGDPGTRPENEESNFAVSLYPNPAETATALRFTLKSPAQVTVKILNSQGQWVSTAVGGGAFGSGSHIVNLPGIRNLSAGVYYCSFETEKIRILRKLLVTR
jgi:hypothetical protein